MTTQTAEFEMQAWNLMVLCTAACVNEMDDGNPGAALKITTAMLTFVDWFDDHGLELAGPPPVLAHVQEAIRVMANHTDDDEHRKILTELQELVGV